MNLLKWLLRLSTALFVLLDIIFNPILRYLTHLSSQHVQLLLKYFNSVSSATLLNSFKLLYTRIQNIDIGYYYNKNQRFVVVVEYYDLIDMYYYTFSTKE
jgi:hypothetical protein